jgi:iron complex outermembrane recepter protein
MREALMKNFGRTVLLSATALVSTIAVSPSLAWAQSTDTPAAEDESGIKDIIVTARKVEENVQDVPLSIKALSGEDLQDRGISSVSDLSLFTPGLSYSPDFGRVGERPVIRGISALRTEAPQPVSVFINGVFVRDGALSVLLDDAAQVEVIKGPQSALFGRATYAGAINYSTVKPGNDVEGRASLTIAGAGEQSAFAAITLPIAKDLISLRLRGKTYKYDGQYTNALNTSGTNSNRIGNEKTRAVGGELRLTLHPSVETRISADYAKDNDGLFAATVRTVPIQAGGIITNPNGTTNVANGATCNGRTINIVGNNALGIPDAAVPAALTTRVNGWPCGAATFQGRVVRRNQTDLAFYTNPATGISYGKIEGLRRENLRIAGSSSYDFSDGYTLAVQSGYTKTNTNVGADQSYNGTRFALGGASWLTYDRDRLTYTSQEIRLSSPQDKALSWLVGAFYYKEKSRGVTTGVIRFAGGAEALRNKSGSEVENLAGFARVQYAVGDALRISAEGRYGEEKVSVVGTPLGTATVSVGTCTAGQVCFVTGSRKFNDFAPRFTVDFKPTEGILLYGQAAKGVKSGGFNTTPGLDAASFAYEGETVWSYELGVKSDWLDRRLRVNIAAFQNDVSDLQLSNISSVQNPFNGTFSTTTIVNNVGKARTKGVEFEVVAKPSSWLTLSGNYALTDAKSIEGTETTNGTVFGGNRSVAGFTLPRSPKHSAAGSADIAIPIGSSGLTFFMRGDVVYQSRRYAEIQNLIWADPFTRLNASIGLGGKNWKAIAFVKNAENDNTSLNGFRYVDPATFRRSAVDFLPRLRQYGFTASVNF